MRFFLSGWRACLAPAILLFCLVCPLHAHDLVDINKFNPNIRIDFRYASFNNYIGCPLYPSNRIFIDRFVAMRLGRVQRDLAVEGLGLLVYQGYRPPSVHEKICAHFRTTGRRNLEEEGAHYCKGLGVDVAVFYLNGQPLHLPCEYDKECAAAYRNYPYVPAHAYHNSAVLEKYMSRHGFTSQRENWWHFDLRGWESAPNLDVEYAQLLQSDGF
jgi:zinc D-Ala-D-Ala dipeptidase